MPRLGRFPVGFTHDIIYNDGRPYLERWVLWFGGTLRLHRFFASDEDRAAHDHPWWFVTLPLTGYGEYLRRGDVEQYREVRAWRLHFRTAMFRHRVELLRFPTWTLVLTGRKSREWGFWPDGEFVHNESWAEHLQTMSRDGSDLLPESASARAPSRALAQKRA
ncbi:MAG: hypothetical protein FJ194_13660 [Gammaproteobacteria bacterium]|nr:hypothetical protein [Gammaproteobacteria bacterium]